MSGFDRNRDLTTQFCKYLVGFRIILRKVIVLSHTSRASRRARHVTYQLKTMRAGSAQTLNWSAGGPEPGETYSDQSTSRLDLNERVVQMVSNSFNIAVSCCSFLRIIANYNNLPVKDALPKDKPRVQSSGPNSGGFKLLLRLVTPGAAKWSFQVSRSCNSVPVTLGASGQGGGQPAQPGRRRDS